MQEIAADVTDDDDEADDVTASVEPTRPDDIKQTKYGTVQISPRSKEQPVNCNKLHTKSMMRKVHLGKI